MAKMPKRRKDKYNPYTLGYDEEKKIYTIEFVDNIKVIHKLEISIELYNIFSEFELEDIRQMHKVERHIEHIEVSEEELFKRGVSDKNIIEEIIIYNSTLEELRVAIEQLSEIQKRRIKKYYFLEKTEQEIALEEGTTRQAVNKSLKEARERLKKILKK